MKFHNLVQGSTSTNQAVIPLTPAGICGSRILNEADAWAHFRLKKLRFRMMVDQDITTNADQAACVVGGYQDTPPSTIVDLMQVIPAVFQPTGQSVPSRWINVPKTDISGPFPWYKTIAGNADPTEEVPGLMVVLSTIATDTYAIEVEGTITFKTSVAPANTPLAQRLRGEIRAERQLLAQQAAAKVLNNVLSNSVALKRAR